MRLLAVLLLAAASLAGQAAAPSRVAVLSYNIHHGEGTDGKLDLERIARVIRSVSPDIVAVQEVDRGTSRTGGVDQAAELARLTGMRAIFGQTIPYGGGQYGNAVLTRLEVERWDNHPLPGVEPRGLLDVATERFTFFATHLDATRDDAKRVEAARQINARMAGSKVPAVLAGDLNAPPERAPIRTLAAEWRIVGGEQERPTSPSGAPRRQIDYILFRPAARWKTVEVRVLDEPTASDHRPIFAVLELLPEP